MPTYQIKAPDGNTYKLDGPEGASDDQVREQVLKQHPNAGSAPDRSVTDKLLGIGGERYQTFPERAVRGLADLPRKLIDAAQSAPAGSHEASQAMVGPAFETALATTPLSPAMRGAAAATGVAAPTVKDIESASNAGYKAARESAVPIEAQAVNDLAKSLSDGLTKVGYRDYLAPKTFRAVEELKALPNPTYQDIESVRQLLQRAGADPVEKDAVRRAIDGLDDFMETLPEGVGNLSKEARGNWSAKRGAETIEEALDKAERQAGSAHSGANTDNAIRQQIKSIRNNPKKSRGFSEEELAQMDAIIHGSPGGNLMRTGGNLLGGGGGLGAAVTAGAGALAAGPLGAAAPLIGYGLKQAGGASTRRQVEQLLEMIRRRSPEAEKTGATKMPTPSRPAADLLAAPMRAAAPFLPDSPLGPNQI